MIKSVQIYFDIAFLDVFIERKYGYTASKSKKIKYLEALKLFSIEQGLESDFRIELEFPQYKRANHVIVTLYNLTPENEALFNEKISQFNREMRKIVYSSF